MCVSLWGVELREGAGVGHHAAHHLLVVVQRRSLTVAHVRQRRRHHTVLAHRVPRLKSKIEFAIFHILTPFIPLRQIGAYRPLRKGCARLRDRTMSWLM